MPAIVVDDVHGRSPPSSRTFARRVRDRGRHQSAGRDPAARRRLGADVDVHPGATIGADVEIGPGSTIHAGARIMAGCKLGAGVTIYPNAVLYERTIVGDRSIVHASVVLGCHGFGYECHRRQQSAQRQLGWVEVGSDCEIGACTTVDRGTYGPTIIGDGTKIDNLVMIAHNCRIGRHNMICSQVGVAGSTTTGDYVVMAGPGRRPRSRAHRRRRDPGRQGRRQLRRARRRPHASACPPFASANKRFNSPPSRKLPEMRRQLRTLRNAVDKLERQRQGPQAPGQQAA